MLVGQNIKKIRESKSISLQQLSDLSGVDHTTLWKIETRDRDARTSTLSKLATALNVEESIFYTKNLVI